MNQERRLHKKKQIKPDAISLEIQPILRAARDYAKMSAALGIKKGADELAIVVKEIKQLNPTGPLNEILIDAELRLQKLNEAFNIGYNGHT